MACVGAGTPDSAGRVALAQSRGAGNTQQPVSRPGPRTDPIRPWAELGPGQTPQQG